MILFFLFGGFYWTSSTMVTMVLGNFQIQCFVNNRSQVPPIHFSLYTIALNKNHVLFLQMLHDLPIVEKFGVHVVGDIINHRALVIWIFKQCTFCSQCTANFALQLFCTLSFLRTTLLFVLLIVVVVVLLVVLRLNTTLFFILYYFYTNLLYILFPIVRWW